MNYTYKIEKVFNEDGIVQVIYSTEGLPDRGANIQVPAGFDITNIDTLIEQHAPIAVWKRLADLPDLSGTAGHTGGTTYALPVTTFEQDQESALRTIDALATAARDRYRSANKDATYLNKSAELDRYIGSGRPDTVEEHEYPYLYNEAAGTGSTVREVADLIEATRTAWVPHLDPKIEGLCRGGKVRVTAATTKEQVATELVLTTSALNAI